MHVFASCSDLHLWTSCADSTVQTAGQSKMRLAAAEQSHWDAKKERRKCKSAVEGENKTNARMGHTHLMDHVAALLEAIAPQLTSNHAVLHGRPSVLHAVGREEPQQAVVGTLHGAHIDRWMPA